MVSSDFGKLDVMRHLISGEDCAIAGEATAATAAPVAETFKKSRRFIKASPCRGRFPSLREHFFQRRNFRVNRRRSGGGFNTEVRLRKRDKGMTALIKRKSHTARTPAQAAGITAWS